MMSTKILLDTGIGGLTFTMSREEIANALGATRDTDDFVPDKPVDYYDDIGLAVICQIENGRVIIESFEIEKQGYNFLGFDFIGKHYDEVINFFKCQHIEDYNQSSHYESKYIFYKNMGIEFCGDITDVVSLDNPALYSHN